VTAARRAAIAVVMEPWRPRPLAWIHRGEARAIAAELRGAGRTVRTAVFRDDAIVRMPSGPRLLRLSDPVMLRASQALGRGSVDYLGPSAGAMARCYDKWTAHRIASAAGIDCPATALAGDASAPGFPLVVKPREGSDSIGLRLIGRGPLPVRLRNDRHIVQERIVGTELTVAVIHGRAGAPLQIDLPAGTPYTFARKYLLRPGRGPVADRALAERVRGRALEAAAALAIDWAARIDFIHETATGRLRFLECDIAPLVGPGSAFAASFAAAGVARGEQLELLLGER
jgi:D-alanine-D-alanine ligase-like ATP-grasp enzyme